MGLKVLAIPSGKTALLFLLRAHTCTPAFGVRACPSPLAPGFAKMTHGVKLPTTTIHVWAAPVHPKKYSRDSSRPSYRACNNSRPVVLSRILRLISI
jgi:hypothetical protein